MERLTSGISCAKLLVIKRVRGSEKLCDSVVGLDKPYFLSPTINALGKVKTDPCRKQVSALLMAAEFMESIHESRQHWCLSLFLDSPAFLYPPSSLPLDWATCQLFSCPPVREKYWKNILQDL